MEMDYIHYLKRDFSLRCEVNPSYSMRAYARDLQVGVSTLSEVFSRKHHLSYKTAQKIVDKMRLSQKEKSQFIDLVILNSQFSGEAQVQFSEQIKKKVFHLPPISSP